MTDHEVAEPFLDVASNIKKDNDDAGDEQQSAKKIKVEGDEDAGDEAEGVEA